jgi:hypothetical protein
MTSLRISYHNNLETGELQILVTYQSAAHTRLADHEKEHFRRVQDILVGAGILSGTCSVRIQRGDMETVYRVEKVGETWDWRVSDGPYLLEEPADRAFDDPQSDSPIKQTNPEPTG